MSTGCGDSPGGDGSEATAAAGGDELPALHHTHLNSQDPDAAVDAYLAIWPEGRRGTMAGYPAFVAEVPILFTRVDGPPPGGWDHELQRAAPQSPFWHLGGFRNTTGLFQRLEQSGVEVLPLWTGPDDRTGVRRSGWTPYEGIRTEATLDTATAAEPRPGGFGYVVGPDGALVELVGGPDTDPSFSHVHLYHEEPACAAAWYVEHLGMELPPGRDEAGEPVPGELPTPCDGVERGAPGWPSLEHAGTLRAPNARVVFSGGSISIYPRQCVQGRCGEDRPLVPSRGQVLDHVAFRVSDLDVRVRALRDAAVEILEEPYPFEGGRAVLVRGPDGLSVELVELP